MVTLPRATVAYGTRVTQADLGKAVSVIVSALSVMPLLSDEVSILESAAEVLRTYSNKAK